MAKEPAGLRRWRLAHKKKRRVRRTKVVKVVARRRYGRKRKGGRRGSKAVPIAQVLVLGTPVVKRFQERGFSVSALTGSLYDLTGFDTDSMKWLYPQKGIANAVVLVALSTIGAKVANRVGANRLIKRATGGMLKLM